MSSTTEGSPNATDSILRWPAPSNLYKPLQPGETRLISLLAGGYDNPLHCELHHASTRSGSGLLISERSTQVQYLALSRSPSDQPDPRAPLICNGSIMGISQTLASALRALRFADRPRWIWSDAICIDQADLEERSEHITLMFRIYSRAERVVVWLGKSSEYVQSVLRDIRAVHFDLTVRESSHRCLASLSARKRIMIYMQQQQWFHNVWSLLEVRAAFYLELRVGGVSVNFEDFIRLARLWRLATPQLKSLASYRCMGGGRPTPSPTGKSLVSKVFSLLSASWLFRASDDRDAVYAPLGALGITPGYTDEQEQHPEAKHAFMATYAQTTSAVYQNLIKYLIILSRNFECLEVLGPRSMDGDIQSWCIDWTKQPYYSSRFPYVIPRHHMRGVGAAYPTALHINWVEPATADSQIEVQRMQAEDELLVYGRRLGTLDRSTTFSIRPGAWRFYDEYCEPLLGHDKLPPVDTEFRSHVNDLLTEGYMKLAYVGDWEDNLSKHFGLTSRDDYMCGVVVDDSAQDGDIVVQLIGSRVVHVVRPAKEHGKYVLVCAGFYWHTVGQRQAVWLEPSPPTFIPQPEVVLWDVIDAFARNLLWRGPMLHCADFRERVLEVAGIQYEPGIRCAQKPDSGEWQRVVRTKVPAHEAFVLV